MSTEQWRECVGGPLCGALILVVGVDGQVVTLAVNGIVYNYLLDDGKLWCAGIVAVDSPAWGDE